VRTNIITDVDSWRVGGVVTQRIAKAVTLAQTPHLIILNQILNGKSPSKSAYTVDTQFTRKIEQN